MKHLIAPLLALVAVACCTPTITPDTVAEPELSPQLAPQAVDNAEMAATRALRSGTNTYAQTCGPLRTKLDANPLPASLKARVDAGRALIGDAPLPRQLKTKPMRLPKAMSALRISAVCNIVSDLTTDGTATNIQALCSDERFKAHAEEAVSNMRWMPFTVGDKATPLPGMITKWEFCTND